MSDVIFLPGIFTPAALRYERLLECLHGVDAVSKDLEVYAEDSPPPDYGIETELAGIAAAADRAGFDRFHLYGQSAGGACVLAFAVEHPERVLSLTLDEPATDFSAEDFEDPIFAEVAALEGRPGPEAVAAFLRLQVAEGVELPPPPEGPPPPWMENRPAGIRAFVAALSRYRVDPARYEAFGKPVLYIHGSLSNPRWAAMCDRLARRFPDFSAELFEGLHHLNSSHQAEPGRTAALLRAHWARGESA